MRSSGNSNILDRFTRIEYEMENQIFWVIQDQWGTNLGNSPKFIPKAFIKWADAEAEANKIRKTDNKTIIIYPAQIKGDVELYLDESGKYYHILADEFKIRTNDYWFRMKDDPEYVPVAPFYYEPEDLQRLVWLLDDWIKMAVKEDNSLRLDMLEMTDQIRYILEEMGYSQNE